MVYLWYNIGMIIAITFLNGMTSRKGNRIPVAVATFGVALSVSIFAWAVFAAVYLAVMYS